jgi:hypothetical protein
VLGLNDHAGYMGNQTPVYDAVFASGLSSLHGFEFRGAGPHANSVSVGGFGGLAGAEYLFPITADDSLRGVLLLDTGTAEPSIKDMEHHRVVPSFGRRITIPTMGPAPIALAFAFTVGARAIGEVMASRPLGARRSADLALLGRAQGSMQPEHGLGQHVVGLLPSADDGVATEHPVGELLKAPAGVVDQGSARGVIAITEGGPGRPEERAWRSRRASDEL